MNARRVTSMLRDSDVSRVYAPVLVPVSLIL